MRLKHALLEVDVKRAVIVCHADGARVHIALRGGVGGGIACTQPKKKRNDGTLQQQQQQQQQKQQKLQLLHLQ
jgi:hypothetical protein